MTRSRAARLAVRSGLGPGPCTGPWPWPVMGMGKGGGRGAFEGRAKGVPALVLVPALLWRGDLRWGGGVDAEDAVAASAALDAPPGTSEQSVAVSPEADAGGCRWASLGRASGRLLDARLRLPDVWCSCSCCCCCCSCRCCCCGGCEAPSSAPACSSGGASGGGRARSMAAAAAVATAGDPGSGVLMCELGWDWGSDALVPRAES